MLKMAYSLAVKAASEKHRALIDSITDQAEWSGCSERGTMESLMEIFEPEDLVRLGYGDRVKAYLAEYGGDGDWDEVSRKAAEHETV